MRILMVTDFYWPYEGGVEQHVRRLSHGLAQRGHSVAVATLRPAALAGYEHDGPVRVHRLTGTLQRAGRLFAHAHRPWAPPFPDPEITRGLQRLLWRERPDIVHGHDWLARSFLPLKASSRARFVMSLHYYTLACAKKNLVRRGEPCLGPAPVKCLVCAAQHYGPGKGLPVTLSNWAASRFERHLVDIFLPVSQATADGNGLGSNDRFEVIPNFMPEYQSETNDVEPFVAQLPDGPFLLFVGDLRRDKGIEVLLSAYAGLADAPPLVLIGKTWNQTPIEFPPNVKVLTDWPNAAVLEAWKRSLIAIVPSLWPEPFGIVIIEAMASGRPVIASRVGGIPEIFRDGHEGLLVKPGDAHELRQAMVRLMADPALREQMGRAGLERAGVYRAAAVVPRIERIYEDLLRLPLKAYEPANSGQHHYQQP
jgi:glycosyltransferase involved in cell wall biosynthesis